EGASTRAEIEQRFGKPPVSVEGANGKSVGSYLFSIDSPPSPNLRPTLYMRCLSILYDRNDIVEKFIHYDSSRTVHEGVTELTIGSPTRATNWIKKGETTANYIIGLRGAPDLKSLTPDGQVVLSWLYSKRQRGNDINFSTERFDALVDQKGVVVDFQL